MTPPPGPVRSLVSKVTDWRVLAAAVVSLAVSGAAFGTWSADLVKQEDLDRALVVPTAERATLRSETQLLRERMARLESDTAWLKSTVYEIAKKLEAPATPPPP